MRFCTALIIFFSSTMTVKAVEAPTAPVYSPKSTGEPSPVFKDENLTVYSIPLYPSADDAMGEDSPARNLKRKRSPSPPTSLKRPSAPAPGSDQIAESTSPVAPALAARADAPDFTPAALTGTDAQEWRRLMLQEMFPMQAHPAADPTLSTKEKRQARKALMESDEPPPPRSKVVSGEKKYARLPQLGLANGSGPRSLPTLAYLCVGPVVRGKFDARKAQELGLPKGPIRARLTKGETVTFEVDDGNGGKVQKTVRPEDCVGPSEMPQVCLFVLTTKTTQHNISGGYHPGRADSRAYPCSHGFIHRIPILFEVPF